MTNTMAIWQVWRVGNIIFLIMTLSLVMISLLTNAWLITEDHYLGLWDVCDRINQTCDGYSSSRPEASYYIPVTLYAVRAAVITAAGSALISLICGFYIVCHAKSKAGVTILTIAVILTVFACLFAISCWITMHLFGSFGFSFYTILAAMILNIFLGAFVIFTPWKILLDQELEMEGWDGFTLKRNEEMGKEVKDTPENESTDGHEDGDALEQSTPEQPTPEQPAREPYYSRSVTTESVPETSQDEPCEMSTEEKVEEKENEEGNEHEEEKEVKDEMELKNTVEEPVMVHEDELRGNTNVVIAKVPVRSEEQSSEVHLTEMEEGMKKMEPLSFAMATEAAHKRSEQEPKEAISSADEQSIDNDGNKSNQRTKPTLAKMVTIDLMDD